jgi:MFS family permease
MRPWAAVGLAGTASFYTAATASMVNVSLHVMRTDLDVSKRAIGLVVSAHLVAVCALLLPAGGVVDRIGAGRAIRVGGIVAALAAMACAVAHALWLLVAMRVVMAAGSALLMASTPSLVVAHVPPEQRGRGLGVQAAMTYVGLVVGPSAGGALASHVSWRGVFVASAVVALGLSLSLLGASDAQVDRKKAKVGLWIAPGLAAAALHYGASFVLSTALPLELGAHGKSPSAIGALFTLVAAVMALAAPVAGLVVDRVGARVPATASLLVSSASLLAIALGSPSLVLLATFGAGAGMFATANTTGVMASAPGPARGAAASWLALARNAGMALGSVVGTGLAYSRALFVAAGAAALGALLAFIASRRDVGPR